MTSIAGHSARTSVLCLLALTFFLPTRAGAQQAAADPATSTPQASSPSAAVPPASATAGASPAPAPASFDPVVATDAYLATVKPEDRARSNAYFEGGYWLQLWDFLLGVFVNLGLLATGLSARMRNLAERLVRFRPLQTLLYFAQYLLVTSLVLFPMTIYEGFVRERKYGLLNQAFGGWLSDQLKGLAVGLVLGGIAVTALYGVVRRLGRRWAVWGAVVAILLVVGGIVMAPVYVFPLFNDFTRLEQPVARGEILSLARAQGVPASDVYVFDASKQTKRVSANVSGLGATMRISLNDNLLNRSSMAEIESIMGHEIGHYVLNHVYKTTLFLGVIIVVGFLFLDWSFARVASRKGSAWGIRGEGDTAGLPLALTLLSVYFFVLTPVLNSWTRTEEAEADLFGIDASGQADGRALGALKLGEYRKLEPTPLEEVLFFDHPSGRNRILMAMRWRAEHLAEADANARRAAEKDRERGWSPEKAAEWARAHEPK